MLVCGHLRDGGTVILDIQKSYSYPIISIYTSRTSLPFSSISKDLLVDLIVNGFDCTMFRFDIGSMVDIKAEEDHVTFLSALLIKSGITGYSLNSRGTSKQQWGVFCSMLETLTWSELIKFLTEVQYSIKSNKLCLGVWEEIYNQPLAPQLWTASESITDYDFENPLNTKDLDTHIRLIQYLIEGVFQAIRKGDPSDKLAQLKVSSLISNLEASLASSYKDPWDVNDLDDEFDEDDEEDDVDFDVDFGELSAFPDVPLSTTIDNTPTLSQLLSDEKVGYFKNDTGVFTYRFDKHLKHIIYVKVSQNLSDIQNPSTEFLYSKEYKVVLDGIPNIIIPKVNTPLVLRESETPIDADIANIRLGELTYSEFLGYLEDPMGYYLGLARRVLFDTDLGYVKTQLKNWLILVSKVSNVPLPKDFFLLGGVDDFITAFSVNEKPLDAWMKLVTIGNTAFTPLMTNHTHSLEYVYSAMFGQGSIFYDELYHTMRALQTGVALYIEGKQTKIHTVFYFDKGILGYSIKIGFALEVMDKFYIRANMFEPRTLRSFHDRIKGSEKPDYSKDGLYLIGMK